MDSIRMPRTDQHSGQQAKSVVQAKIDIFFRSHVLPYFHPDDIFWWLSLSGGKDSLCMAHGIREWYLANGHNFAGQGLHFNQWGVSGEVPISQQLPWLDVRTVDAVRATRQKTQYIPGQQAPCRLCADVRRDLGDAVMRHGAKNRKICIVARGLHLTDTAVSCLWRFAEGLSPFAQIRIAGKCRPLVPLWRDVYLAKPLYYVREFETQELTHELGFRPTCCGCPACKYPSRRDLVEETIAQHMNDPLWEFRVPGISELLGQHDSGSSAEDLSAISLPGKESKHNRLPSDFPDFVVSHFQSAVSWAEVKKLACIWGHGYLDDIGSERLSRQAPLINRTYLPRPKLLSTGIRLSREEALGVAAFGPFWGAIGLEEEERRRAFAIQKRLFGMTPDSCWTHVWDLINAYYGRHNGSDKRPKNGSVCCISCAGSTFGST